MPVYKVVPLDSQALELQLADFAELLDAREPIVADRQMSEIREEFDAVETGQVVVTQKQLLNFRELIEEGLVLHMRGGPIELKRGDVLVVKRQLVTSDHQPGLLGGLIPGCTVGAWSVRSLALVSLTI